MDRVGPQRNSKKKKVSNGSIITKYRIEKDEGRRGAGLISFIRRLRIAAKRACDLRHVLLSVILFACISAASTGQISVKFDNGAVEKFQIWLK
jgi:hypothetical protein